MAFKTLCGSAKLWVMIKTCLQWTESLSVSSRGKTVMQCMLMSTSVCVCVVQVRESLARLRHHLSRNQMLEGTSITATILAVQAQCNHSSLAQLLGLTVVCIAHSPIFCQMPVGQ